MPRQGRDRNAGRRTGPAADGEPVVQLYRGAADGVGALPVPHDQLLVGEIEILHPEAQCLHESRPATAEKIGDRSVLSAKWVRRRSISGAAIVDGCRLSLKRKKCRIQKAYLCSVR